MTRKSVLLERKILANRVHLLTNTIKQWKLGIITNECILWNKDKPNEYGQYLYKKEIWIVSRLSYYLAKGEFPKGLYILHSCDTPGCFNPTHLRVGTAKENTADMLARHPRYNKMTKIIDPIIQKYLNESSLTIEEENNVTIDPIILKAIKEIKTKQKITPKLVIEILREPKKDWPTLLGCSKTTIDLILTGSKHSERSIPFYQENSSYHPKVSWLQKHSEHLLTYPRTIPSELVSLYDTSS